MPAKREMGRAQGSGTRDQGSGFRAQDVAMIAFSVRGSGFGCWVCSKELFSAETGQLRRELCPEVRPASAPAVHDKVQRGGFWRRLGL